MPRLVKVDGKVQSFPDDATDAEISAALNASPAKPTETGKARTWTDTALDVGVGVAKGAAHTALGLGELVHQIPGVSAAVDTLYGVPGLSEKAFPAAREATAFTNTPQMVGGALETVGELAVPVTRAAEALPTVAKAGQKFDAVMAAAKNLPVDTSAAGNVALRIQELAERGGSMPMTVRKLIGRMTDPNKGPLDYEEARDFAGNISRLSSNEYNRLTPVIAREVSHLRATLNSAIAATAGKAGKGAEYAQAMNEYARAVQIRSIADSFIDAAKRGFPYASAAGAGYWAAAKLKGLLPD